MKWGVWARVSGGYTGTRESWCKRDGELMTFATEAGARAYATELNVRMNHGRSTAQFRYSARPLSNDVVKEQ